MLVFHSRKGELSKVDKQVLNESQIQKIVEENLKAIFQLDLVASQFKFEPYNRKSLRADTIAFDSSNRSFVIIEYKGGGRSSSDQGRAYRNSLRDNWAVVLKAYNGKFYTHKNYDDIEWDDTKVLYITPSFSRHQIEGNKNEELIELWQIEHYENGLLILNQINNSKVQRDVITMPPLVKPSISGINTKKYTLYLVCGHTKRTDSEKHGTGNHYCTRCKLRKATRKKIVNY